MELAVNQMVQNQWHGITPMGGNNTSRQIILDKEQ
jgi:hypothetical protein